MSHFAPAKCDGRFHLAAFLQKTHDVVLLYFKIVFSGARSEFDFLQLNRFLVLACIVLALVLLVEIFDIIDNRQTGGVARGETSTRSSPRSRAIFKASQGGMMPSCFPSSSTTRTSRARILSLIRTKRSAIGVASRPLKSRLK